MTRLATCLVLVSTALVAQQPELNELEKEFQDSLTNVLFEGQSSRDGKPGVSDDKYTIEKVAKQSGDTWTFFVRTNYQGKQVTLPFPIQVKWAGDTPVITLTDQAIPGMGSYTARVLVYRGHYAGTWSGKAGGGKVWGRVVKQSPQP
ncbi:MAG TPA: hypothetical protein VEQ63_03250 [Bryobacteraceae bacterium]|nr:hypothetical protein [Bryobacteraceae bacterium]